MGASDADRSSEAGRSLGFLDGVSHELRTPLSSILAFADLSLRAADQLPPRDRAAWNEVDASAKRLAKTIDNVLDIMYLDSGKAACALDFVDLVDVVGVVEQRMRPAAEVKAIEFVVFVANGVPFVEADPEKLRRALENIVDNALTFTPSGGRVVLHAFHCKIAGEVRIYIDDNGIGIAPCDFDRVFERYQQVDATASRSFDGCGLGLAVAHEFIAMHGGRIDMESALGQGSTFIVVLPAATAN